MTTFRFPRRIGRRVAVAALAVGLSGVLTPVAVAAQAKPVTISWSVAPSSGKNLDGRTHFAYTDIKPGAVITDHVGITNFSTHPVTFKVYAVDGVTTSSGDIGLAQAKTKPVDIGVMVHVSHPSVTVPPHARVNAQFTVDVPHNATPGDHVGGIIASVTEARGGGKVAREDRVGVAMYLRVHGPLHPLLNIESVSTTGYHGTPNPFGGGSTSVSYTVHNTGNVRLSADQAVSVTGLFGIPLATVHPESLAELLPGGSVRVTARLNGIFPLAPLGLHVKVTPKPVPGSPKLTVPLTPTEYSVGLNAMPWTQLVLLVVLIALGVVLYRWLRGRQRRQADAVAAALEQGRREAQLSGVGAREPEPTEPE